MPVKVPKKVEVQGCLCVHANAVQLSRSGHVSREFVAESKKKKKREREQNGEKLS